MKAKSQNNLHAIFERNVFLLGFCAVLSLVSCASSESVDSAGDKPKVGAVTELRGGGSPLAVEQSPDERQGYEARSAHFMIATQGKAATEAARKIYAQKGNIIDAAIAASFVISVERPQSTGLGGGGFLLFREAKTGRTYAVDFRERAPLKATERMYLDAKGDVVPNLSTEGALASGVPGLVAGLLEIHRKFGKLPLKAVMEPAIELAEKGFAVYPHLARAMASEKDGLSKFPASKEIYLKTDGAPYDVGEILVQKDLARTLRLIATKGRAVFYRGSLARAIARESASHHGLITRRDLSSYKVKWRQPLRGNYKGFEVQSFPPPSSGGTHVIEILNILEGEPLEMAGFQSAEAYHYEASAMQQAFADRARFMGDPDFLKGIPVKGLLSKSYAEAIRGKIDPQKAKRADEVGPGDPPRYESSETTNFTLMDIDGNAVVSTQTVNDYFGSKVVVPGTGIVLNNEMDDFSAKPGASNLFGAIGGEANAIRARKTPLSSMSPTIVLKDGRPMLALGAPGGTRIFTCVAQTLVNYLEFKLPLYESVASLRFHHQWQPDQLDMESPGPSEAVLSRLKGMGYAVNIGRVPCVVNAVAREQDILHGVADPRDLGAASGD